MGTLRLTQPAAALKDAEPEGKPRFEDLVRRVRNLFLVKNKANKLLKIQGSVPESDKTIPMSHTLRSREDSSRTGGYKGTRLLKRGTCHADPVCRRSSAVSRWKQTKSRPVAALRLT